MSCAPPQIAAFLMPLCVLIAAGMGLHLDLDLGTFETGSLVMAVLMLVYITSQVGSGRTTPRRSRPRREAPHPHPGQSG